MPRILKVSLAVLVSLAALAAGLFAAAVWMGERKSQRVVDVRVVPVTYVKDPAALKLGKYIFESRGCGECHSMDGRGRVLVDEGGMYIRTPNLTTGKAGVVANYSEADWVRAIRHGVDPRGRPLFIMPSEDYNRMTDADFAALVAYIRSLPPVDGLPAEIRRPLVLRALYGAGLVPDAAEKIDHRLPPAAPVAVGVSAEHGGYVAQMCVGCHGPKFAGGPMAGAPPAWPPAAKLTPGEGSVLPRYDTPEKFIAMMRTGKRPDGSEVSKVMPFETLRNLNDTDLRAMHAYFSTLAPLKGGAR